MKMMYLPENTVLQGGKYRIVRFISAGGFGCTYEAEHVMLHKRVAIKEFFVKDFCNRDEQTSHVTIGTQTKVALVSKLKKKFLEEAIALSRLHHVHIVQVTDVFEENGTAYYVMDFINGRSVHEILKTQSTIPEAQAVKYICQVAEALKQVHAENRLHLDIKPGNIMIDEHDNAILIDFGASKQYDEESGENTSTLMGKTPGYAPIEQMGNSVQTFTPATDIYSLGATLYKMLTGIMPPEANLLVSDDESLQPLPSHISAETRNAVEQAMKVKCKDRLQSVEEFMGYFDKNTDGEKENEVTLLAKNLHAFLVVALFVVPISIILFLLRVRNNPEPASTEMIDSSYVQSFPILYEEGDTAYLYTGKLDEKGLPCGIGEAQYEYGEYRGSFKDGYKDGKGTFILNDGDTLEGLFSQDAFLEGTVKHDYGTRIGKFSANGTLEGQGKFIDNNGDVYEGYFEMGWLKDGTLTKPDGSYFTGKFKGNRQPSSGTWYNSNGELIKNI